MLFVNTKEMQERANGWIVNPTDVSCDVGPGVTFLIWAEKDVRHSQKDFPTNTVICQH